MLRPESLFTQDKESGTRLIITFFEFCFECENIIFDVVVAERQVSFGSIENTGYQLRYPIGVPIWVLSFIKVVDKADKSG